MIEKGFNYADSTVKEMTDFFNTKVENWNPGRIRGTFLQSQKQTRKRYLSRKLKDHSNSSVM